MSEFYKEFGMSSTEWFDRMMEAQVEFGVDEAGSFGPPTEAARAAAARVWDRRKPPAPPTGVDYGLVDDLFEGDSSSD